jgi:hypothetical protein
MIVLFALMVYGSIRMVVYHAMKLVPLALEAIRVNASLVHLTEFCKMATVSFLIQCVIKLVWNAKDLYQLIVLTAQITSSYLIRVLVIQSIVFLSITSLMNQLTSMAANQIVNVMVLKDVVLLDIVKAAWP